MSEEIETQEIEPIEPQSQEPVEHEPVEQEGEPEEIDITIGDPVEPTEEELSLEDLKRNSAWVKARKEKKELQERARQLEQELQALKTPIEHEGSQSDAVLEKPTLEDCDYDAEVYEATLLNWARIQRENDEKIAQEQAAKVKQQQEWNQTVEAYHARKASLPVKDFDEREEIVASMLKPSQQGLILKYAKEPEKLIYALGKSPEKLKELAEIADPIALALKLREIENLMKITSRNKPAPEAKIVGGSRIEPANAHLEKLREEAMRTGNFTKVVAYKTQLKAKQ